MITEEGKEMTDQERIAALEEQVRKQQEQIAALTKQLTALQENTDSALRSLDMVADILKDHKKGLDNLNHGMEYLFMITPVPSSDPFKK